MSAKKSKSSGGGGGGWFTCPKCERRMPRNFSGKHADSDCGTVLPFIRNRRVHAAIGKATTSSKIMNLPFTKNNRISSSTIFLPDEVIRESGFRTFSWVLMHLCDDGNENEEDNRVPPIALRVWPTPESIQGSAASSISAYTVMMTPEGFISNIATQLISSGASGDGPSVVCLETLLDTDTPGVTCLVVPVAKTVSLRVQNSTSDSESFDATRFIKTFKTVFNSRLLTRGNQFQLRYFAELVRIEILDIISSEKGRNLDDAFSSLSISRNKSEYFEMVDDTDVFVENLVDSKEPDTDRNLITLKDVGGMHAVVKELCSTINFILNADMDVPKGILLHGQSGTGKTLLIDAICNHFKLNRFNFDECGTELPLTGNFSSLAGSSKSLLKLFHDAKSKWPSVIVIENLDNLSVKSSKIDQDLSSPFGKNLISLASSITSKIHKVIILATATDADAIISAIRSPKMFSKEIELPVPSARERYDILSALLRGVKTSLDVNQIHEISLSTHGFVGADLKGLVIQGLQKAVERCKNEKMDSQCLTNINLQFSDLLSSLKIVKPSAVKSILVDVPNVKWSDIGGQDDLKFKFKQAVEWPLKHPEAFRRLGVTPPKGILMYGPPGCSKTMIAKAIATESGLNFISVKGSELFSKWVGESEKAVRDVFRKARQVAPCVIFFDEIDSLGGERGSSSGSSNVHERVLAQLLVEMDGVEPLKDVTIIAATNRPDIIDQALLRPGRLDRIIYVPLPNLATRKEIFRLAFKKMPTEDSVNIDKLAQVTEYYSGAELTAVCHEAAMKALEEDINCRFVCERHLTKALEIIKPRICKSQIDFYENYSNKHGKLT